MAHQSTLHQAETRQKNPVLDASEALDSSMRISGGGSSSSGGSTLHAKEKIFPVK